MSGQRRVVHVVTYPAGEIGLLAAFGNASFDNVAVFGQNAFLTEEGTYEVLFEDPFNHIDLDGMPYMWGFYGNWQMATDDAAHGKVLKGTASTLGTVAFRGDRGWINGTGETDYMNYFVQADVKLVSASGIGWLCLRLVDFEGLGNRFYGLRLDRAQGSAELWCRYNLGAPTNLWQWEFLGLCELTDPAEWCTISVRAINETFECRVNGTSLDVTDTHDLLHDGLVGFWVESGDALFDNMKVLDLR